jgi:HTH-type transcriptional regulator / antitoxin HigA
VQADAVERPAKAHMRAFGGYADEIAAQARQIQDYEQTHFPIPDPGPIDALLFRMEQEGIDRKGLCDLLGASTGRVSEVLTGRRPLSISMIRTLHGKLGIPGDIHIKASRKRAPRSF